MPKYKVTLEETAEYTIEVTAENEDEACEVAEAKFLGSIKCDFPTDVLERDVTNVEEAA